jgi:hypothetical protein
MLPCMGVFFAFALSELQGILKKIEKLDNFSSFGL